LREGFKRKGAGDWQDREGEKIEENGRQWREDPKNGKVGDAEEKRPKMEKIRSSRKIPTPNARGETVSEIRQMPGTAKETKNSSEGG